MSVAVTPMVGEVLTLYVDHLAASIIMNFYYEASSVLDRLDAKKGSIKGIIGSLPEKNRKRTAALVIETLKYKAALCNIIESSSLLDNEHKHLSKNLALVLVHDFLFARGGIQASDGPVKQAVFRHKTRLHAELVKFKLKIGVRTNSELASEEDSRADHIPRYVRVNTIKWTTKEAIEYFETKGYSSSTSPFESKMSFVADEHVPDLLCFHPSVAFHNDIAYADGRVILQDKASCFPSLVLITKPHENIVTLDATAAPGNKTTHLSAIMRNKGKVLALERDRRRFATLQSMISKAGCGNIEAFNLDFLSTEPLAAQFSQVSHILLDPSCSGSGIVNRLDYLLDVEQENKENQKARLEKLATFQLTMIRHAMKFPRVVKIVYSTCSMHAAENEHVVAQALDSEEAHAGGFTLAPRAQVLPTWERRGLTKELGKYQDLAESLVRCAAGDDLTNGFFVSCFIRGTKPSNTSLKRKFQEQPGQSEGGNEGHAEEDGTVKKAKKKRKRKQREAVV